MAKDVCWAPVVKQLKGQPWILLQFIRRTKTVSTRAYLAGHPALTRKAAMDRVEFKRVELTVRE